MRRACLLLAALLVALPVIAQEGSTNERLTVDSTSGGVALATTTFAPTSGPWAGRVMTYCEGRLETAQIRFQDDGQTAVTSSAGTILDVGDIWIALNPAIARRTRFIRTGSTSGVLEIRCYERRPQ